MRSLLLGCPLEAVDRTSRPALLQATPELQTRDVSRRNRSTPQAGILAALRNSALRSSPKPLSLQRRFEPFGITPFLWNTGMRHSSSDQEHSPEFVALSVQPGLRSVQTFASGLCSS